MWSKEERLEVVKAIYETGVFVFLLCFSGHRRYTHWVQDPVLEEKSLDIIKKNVLLAQDTWDRTRFIELVTVFTMKKSPPRRHNVLSKI